MGVVLVPQWLIRFPLARKYTRIYVYIYTRTEIRR